MKDNITIGIATYNDFDGVYFTIQSLRFHHELSQAEFIVIDTCPTSKQGVLTEKFIKNIPGAKYLSDPDGGSWAKYKTTKYATRDYMLVTDCHVLLRMGAIEQLMLYFQKHPNTKDLIQGPVLLDSLHDIRTHMLPKFHKEQYGVFVCDVKKLKENNPFEIPLQGMGCFAFRTESFPQICPLVRGYGSEEGYIQELFRINGGKNICIPSFQWIHRFYYPGESRHKITLENKIWNFFVSWMSIDINHKMVRQIYDYFSVYRGHSVVHPIYEDAKNAVLKSKIIK